MKLHRSIIVIAKSKIQSVRDCEDNDI